MTVGGRGVANGNPIRFFRPTEGNLWKIPQRRSQERDGWRGRRRGKRGREIAVAVTLSQSEAEAEGGRDAISSAIVSK